MVCMHWAEEKKSMRWKCEEYNHKNRCYIIVEADGRNWENRIDFALRNYWLFSEKQSVPSSAGIISLKV